MRKHGHMTSFYLEVMLLILVFVSMIMLLTEVFGKSRLISSDAEVLTNAVCLAQNAAEAVSASSNPEEVVSVLDEGGNVRTADGGVEAYYDRDMNPDDSEEADLKIKITWEPVPDKSGLVRSEISVYGKTTAEPVYQLVTAVCTEEVIP